MSVNSKIAERSLHRARGFLEYSTDRDSESLLTQLSFDRRFKDTFARADARTAIRQRTATEVGFDFGVEAFSSMIGLMLSACPDTVVPPPLIKRFVQQVESCRRKGRYSFFVDVPEFAADTDCTAMAAGALYEHGLISVAELASSSEALLRASASDPCSLRNTRPSKGEVHPHVLLVYWEDTDRRVLPRARRHDAVACANALYTLSLLEAPSTPVESEVMDATIRYVSHHLNSRRYLSGTRYYPSPEAFLYAASRLCARFGRFSELFTSALRREISAAPGRLTEDPLNLALSIISASNVGMMAGQAQRRERLARLQRNDGSWPAAPYYRMGRFQVYFGSPLITTLFAARAMQADCAGHLATDPLRKKGDTESCPAI
ncbi:hypothetical protein [Wenjunlia tyrosinilytica]|uniref:Uncharacterized protein n=1 Tax=Wenjunlia tyrosinilytica TaxID=1544741 RepID=A0A917ZW48_9ACTN|nr:hypothetical protein [Wenjunlia tyrosinilytica]GGO93385.1 hypothetical protein GCM10012280_45800 [Wenjunlia tyrosinilytica]